MAFRHPTPAPPQLHIPPPTEEEFVSKAPSRSINGIQDSQEWILFSPSQIAPSTTAARTNKTSRTADLSHLSDFGSFGGRLGQAVQSNDAEGLTEDSELDSLDDGLQAFRELPTHGPISSRSPGPVLPTHDGLGTFPSSRPTVQEHHWQHVHGNPKRKFEGNHWARSTSQKRIGTIEELDPRINEDKRLRIEQWRAEQSQALLVEIEKETRRKNRRQSATAQGSTNTEPLVGNDAPGREPSHRDMCDAFVQEDGQHEPLWRRIARRFIQDVIGIDEPLLSVIVGETLPVDICAIAELDNATPDPKSPNQLFASEDTWPDRLLHRIARELGLLMHKVSSHRDDTKVSLASPALEYAGMPVINTSTITKDPLEKSNGDSTSNITPLFSPTVEETSHNASWGLDDHISGKAAACSDYGGDDLEKVRKEQEYWERELDIKMVFHFLKNRFYSKTSPQRPDTAFSSAIVKDNSIRRADIIRRHHPLVTRARQPSLARLRRESNLLAAKRPASSCASENMRSGFQHSIAKSGGNSHEYWDIGGSIGSGSVLASCGMMGAWGEV